MDLAQRIAQFENMAQADPTNEMAHFSLAGAYLQAGRPGDAAERYLRCVELVPDMSKAYQLAAESLIKANQNIRAAAVLIQGYTIAAQKGDLMPKTAMANLLKEMGESVPDVEPSPSIASGKDQPSAPDAVVPEGMIRCKSTGKIGTRFLKPPFKGRVGTWIAANVSQETFMKGWIPQGTKVINELRLDLSRDKDNETYDQHMREYLGLDEESYRRLMDQ